MATVGKKLFSNNGSPHFPKEEKEKRGLCSKETSSASSIMPSSKDVFRGEVLVNRLLVYYTKFEGSRGKAVKYAQKLLDLGHIESLTHSEKFEDSAHVYRWTDVAQVINKNKGAVEGGKTPTMEPGKKPPKKSPPSKSSDVTPKAILKISIETDNCDGADIQARIRAHPRLGANRASAPFDTKTVMAAVNEDSFFGAGVTKALSYVTEPTTDELSRETITTPIITELSPSPKQKPPTPPARKKTPTTNGETPKAKKHEENVFETPKHAENKKHISPLANEARKRDSPEPKAAPRKTLFGNSKPKSDTKSPRQDPNRATETASRPLAFKSATEPALVERKTAPGPGAPKVDAEDTRDFKPRNVHHSHDLKSPQGATEDMKTATQSFPKTSNQENSSSENKRGDNGENSFENNEVKNGEDNGIRGTSDGCQPTFVASTQTSEKSILRTSKLYDPNKHPPGVTTQTTSSLLKSQPSSGGNQNPVTSKNDVTQQTKTRELQRINENKKKTRFADDEDTEVANDPVQRNGSELTKESTGMSLHSSGFVEGENGADGFDHMSIPISPPPPSPVALASSPVPQEGNTPQLKSLFWNKISRQLRRISTDENRVFWEECEDSIVFDQDQFEKLFSRPPAALPSPRGKGQSRSREPGKTLKVLGMERSRLVGIRAGSVRLPVEEIHDTIINMDDDKLDVDGLQALYDIRPSPEELDEIADALKAHPKGILDKPEQFVLMLAMIPNLDERLECWIFAKKFPDRMVEIQEQLAAVTEACQFIVNNVTLKRVLETVLLLGNHLNKGTQRGDAYGYHLDILPKLKDVKSKGGEFNLLQFTVKTVRDQMKAEGKLSTEELTSPRMDDNTALPEQDVILKAASAPLHNLGDDLEVTALELEDCKLRLLPSIIHGSTIPAESEVAEEKLESFLGQATAKMREMAQIYQDTLAVAEEFQNYFIPADRAEAREPFAIMLQSIATFCDDFRAQWVEETRQEMKEQFCKLERGKRQRINALRVTNTPSALKERFMERRRRERRSTESRNSTEPKTRQAISVPPQSRQSNGTSDPGKRPELKAKRSYRFQSEASRESLATSNGYTPSERSIAGVRQRFNEDAYSELSNRNAIEIERRMNELSNRKY